MELLKNAVVLLKHAVLLLKHAVVLLKHTDVLLMIVVSVEVDLNEQLSLLSELSF